MPNPKSRSSILLPPRLFKVWATLRLGQCLDRMRPRIQGTRRQRSAAVSPPHCSRWVQVRLRGDEPRSVAIVLVLAQARIYDHRRELRSYARSWPLRPRSADGSSISICPVSTRVQALLPRFVDHVNRVLEQIDSLRETLTFAFEATVLLQSSRQGTGRHSPAGLRSWRCRRRSPASTA